VKRAWVLAVLTVASVTGLGYVHPFGNPRVEPARGLGTLLHGANLPSDAKAVLVTKCADCHSSETRWPVYARVAPGSWLIERDIVEARKHMDLSRWELLSIEQQHFLLDKISHESMNVLMTTIQYVALIWCEKL
jgi:cytochrome c